MEKEGGNNRIQLENYKCVTNQIDIHLVTLSIFPDLAQVG
jgi:hypothetical protein